MAASQPTDRAEDDGLSSLRAALTRILEGPDAPPGGTLAVHSPEGVATVAAGYAQTFDQDGPLAEPVAMTSDTRIDLGSVTKVVGTTTAVMALVDRGSLSLDHTVGELVPHLADRAVAGATVRDLLLHRAGLWEWWPLYLSASEPDSALDVATRLPLRYPARTGRHYSDLGFQLLGAIVAGVTGLPLSDAVAQLSLEPFGLHATRYARPAPGGPVVASSSGDRIERTMVETGVPYPVTGDAAAFPRWRTHVLVGEVNDGNAFHAFGGAAGHAGLWSTVPDLLTYGRALLASLDGRGPLRAATVEAFLRPGPDSVQALGFRRYRPILDGRPVEAFGHPGFPGVFLAGFPDLGAVVALSTNRLHRAGMLRSLDDLVAAALVAALRHLRYTAS